MRLMGKYSRIDDCQIGDGTIIWDFVNLFGCSIGRDCKVGSHVEIGRGVTVGDRCKIEPYAFLPSGVTIEDEVFVGPHVSFTNDTFPRAVGDWETIPTIVRRGASIGANSTIVCGITIGEGAMIGAGSVVTRNVPPDTVVAGNPAKEIRRIQI